LIAGGTASPDHATFYNGTLVRYLDYNDGYLAKGETCHPSDNLSAVLAAAEYAKGTGRDLLTALAVAYQVQCRLSDEAPVRAKGFDHTTQGPMRRQPACRERSDWMRRRRPTPSPSAGPRSTRCA
jgi:2-methylcitrate dehydratase